MSNISVLKNKLCITHFWASFLFVFVLLSGFVPVKVNAEVFSAGLKNGFCNATNVSAGSTRYLDGGVCATNESPTRIYVYASTTLKNLVGTARVNSTGYGTTTVMVNGGASSLSCTYAPTVLLCNDLVNSVNLVPGDYFNVRFQNAVGTITDPSYSLGLFQDVTLNGGTSTTTYEYNLYPDSGSFGVEVFYLWVVFFATMVFIIWFFRKRN